MSWGLKASILIALQSRRGQWCHPNWIAQRVIARADTVERLCQDMAIGGEISMAAMPGSTGEIPGDLIFGVDIPAEGARINEVEEPTA